MTGSRALVVSVIAHAAVLGAIAWLVDDHDDHDERDYTARAHRDDRESIAIELPPLQHVPPADYVELALLPDEAAVVAPAAVAGSRRATRAAVDTGAGRPIDPPEVAVDPRPNPYAMRGLRHDLALSAAAIERILQAGAAPVEPEKPTGHIEQHGREGRIDDPVARYVVHGDGTVDVRGKKLIDLHWFIPLPTPTRILNSVKAFGDDLAAWREDPYRDRRAGTWQDLPRHLQAIPGACESYGDPLCEPAPTGKISKGMGGNGTIIPILGGQFDLTGYLHQKFVGDPYASRKLKMLDDTRAERASSGATYRAEQLDHSAELMARNLAALWRARPDPATRRQALFDLWDECVEGEGHAGAAGDRARAMVIGWIVAHLPAGQPGAYTPDDIARLDAKRSSKQHFAPY